MNSAGKGKRLAYADADAECVRDRRGVTVVVVATVLLLFWCGFCRNTWGRVPESPQDSGCKTRCGARHCSPDFSFPDSILSSLY
jgi:hypothetical protein